GLSSGNVTVQAGDSAPGEKKAWVTSEFAVAQILTLVVSLLYPFFLAVAAGMTVIHDDELQVGELLHSSGLRPAEYVWGKFLGVLVCFGAVLGLHLLCMMFVLHVLPGTGTAGTRGPFAVRNYLSPALVMVVPTLIFLAGTSFAAGVWTRRP